MWQHLHILPDPRVFPLVVQVNFVFSPRLYGFSKRVSMTDARAFRAWSTSTRSCFHTSSQYRTSSESLSLYYSADELCVSHHDKIMAEVNGVSHSRDFEPPASSMIATRVFNGHGRPDLSPHQFAELLQESLATNEKGEPNISDDADTNFKLLTVVVSIGIEPYIEESDDPFQKQIDQGRNLSELKSCLDVVRLVIDRSPIVIHEPVHTATENVEEKPPVYAWLLSILLSVIAQDSSPEISSSCKAVLESCLKADEQCPCGSCGTVTELARETLSGESVQIRQHRDLTRPSNFEICLRIFDRQ